MKIRATVKINDNGFYEVYSANMIGPYELDGYGKNEEDAKADFMKGMYMALNEMRQDNDGVLPPEWAETTVEYIQDPRNETTKLKLEESVKK